MLSEKEGNGNPEKVLMVGEAFYRSGKGKEFERELVGSMSSDFISPSRIREIAEHLKDEHAQESQHEHKALHEAEQLTEQ